MMKNPDARQQILEAAEERFQIYGFKKTTMAEIAQDCAMSAANLYRHFENKLDICGALAEQCLEEKEQALGLVVDAEMPAGEKLSRFIEALLEYNHSYIQAHPKIIELIESVSQQCPDIVLKHNESIHKLVAKILTEGKESGEFQFDDMTATTEAISTAIMLFSFPVAMELFDYPTLKARSVSITQLLLNGLLARS